MKRMPLFVCFIAVMALSASLAYWALQLFKLPQRPIAAAPIQSAPEASLDAAADLFGGQAVSVVVSNYQLKGVVVAGNGRGSAAILSVDGKPPQAVPVGREFVSGVTLREVHPKHVLLSEGGVIKRVELAGESERAAPPAAVPLPGQIPVVPVVPAAVPVPGQPQAPARMTVSPTIIVPPPSAAGADRTR